MLTRSEMDDLRVRIADAADAVELRALAERLHAELERSRIAEGNDIRCIARLADTAAECRAQRDAARDEREAAVRERDKARRVERDARLLLAGLVAAGKAALAAFQDGQPEAARAILGHELYAHGWQPAPGSHAPQILADAAAAFHDAGLATAIHAAA